MEQIFMIFGLLRLALSGEVLSVHLNKNSSVFYPLPGIFKGNNLTFTTNCSSSEDNSTNIDSDITTLETLSFRLAPNLRSNNSQTIQMATRWLNGYGLGFYYTDTKVVCIKVNTTIVSAEVNWFYDFSSLNIDGNIAGVQPLIIPGDQFLLFVAFNSKENNSFFILNYTNSNISSNRIFLNELNEVENMIVHYNFRSSFVAISGDIENITSLYYADLSNPNNAHVKKITYIESEANWKFVDIHPISAFLFEYLGNVNLIVLDESKYIIIYDYSNEQFIETSSLSLDEYNNPKFVYPYTYNGEYQNQLFVYTDSGILLVDLANRSELLFMNSIVNNVQGFFESNKFLYLINEIDSYPGVAIAHLDYPGSILFNYKLNCESCESYKFWGNFQGNGLPILLKIDTEKFTLTIIKTAVPIVEFYADQGFSFNCYIFAKEGGAGNRISQQKKVLINVLDNSYYDIKKISDGNAATKKFYLNQNISRFSLPIDFVSGWNKQCSVINQNLTIGNESLNIASSYKNNYQEFMTVELGDDFLKAYFLDIFIISIKESLVELTSIIDNSKSIIYISNVSHTRYTRLSPSQSALVFLYESSKIYLYSYPTGKSKYQDIHTVQEITLFDLVSTYLIVANPNFVEIYSFNSTSYNYELLSSIVISSSNLVNLKCVSRNNANMANLLYLRLKSDSSTTTIQVFNLDTINIYSFPNLISEKNIADFNYFNVTRSSCLFFYDTQMKVYDSLLNQQLFTFPINVTNTWILNNTFIGRYNDSVVVFNSSESLLSKAVRFSVKMIDKLIGYNYFRSNKFFQKNGSAFATVQGNRAVLHFLDCPNPYNYCSPSTPFNVQYYPSFQSKNSTFPAQINVRCSNGIGRPLDILFDAVFYAYGMKIFFDQGKDIVIKIAYPTESTFPIRQYVQGSDLQFDLEINGKNVSASSKYAPFNIQHSVDLVINFPTEEQIFSISLIQNTTLILYSTTSGYVFLYDYQNTVVSNISLTKLFNSTCQIIETVARSTHYVLFAVVCTTNISQAGYNITKTTIGLIVFSFVGYLNNFTFWINNTDFEIGILRVVTASIEKFALILVEKTNRANNHVQVIFGSWDGRTLTGVLKNITMNFYTMQKDKFLCEGADGFYDYTGLFHLHLVDSYYGLRIFNYSGESFEEIYNYSISQPVKSIGVCGTLLFIGCLDTSVITFSKRNSHPEYIGVKVPYNNSTKNYIASSGFINCNNYYKPSFVLLSIESSDSYVMRIINNLIEPSSSVLRDIFISSNTPSNSYYSNAYFINSSMFFVADTDQGRILGYRIQSPSLFFPKFSTADYQLAEKQWGENPFKYKFTITSGNITYRTQTYQIDRGDLKVSNSSVSTKIPAWKVALIIIGVLFALMIIGLVSYKYFWNRKRKLEDLKSLNSERHTSVFYRSTLQFFVINRTSY